jgi:hypothetical protein
MDLKVLRAINRADDISDRIKSSKKAHLPAIFHLLNHRLGASPTSTEVRSKHLEVRELDEKLT